MSREALPVSRKTQETQRSGIPMGGFLTEASLGSFGFTAYEKQTVHVHASMI